MEVIAVATIIAILALILIPILTTQVEKSREVAVSDEMSNLAKVASLAYAETNHYYRLQDYDNRTTYYPDRIDDPTVEVPVMYFGEPTQVPPQAMSAAERARFKDKWEGPYTSFHKYGVINDLYLSFPKMFSVFQVQSTGGGLLQASGPIVVHVSGALTNTATPPEPPTQDERRDLYPLDPWGNPYIFFPTGYLVIPGVMTESTYSPALYSLGPDGLPGSPSAGGPTDPAGKDYFPYRADKTGGFLGTGDDITWKF